MSPASRTVRLPSAALIVLSSIVHLTSAHPYALPQPTKTLDYRELHVLPWPLAATAAPGNLDDLLNRRALNTVCGYIGGDPSLPATCSAGSHCVIEVEHGAVGCCPDSGACTQGVYTGCVDLNSGAQSEVNPYVFTCQGSDVCYKNSFEGGYTQYGCGTSSGMATTVVGTASGKSTIHLTSISVSATQTAESSESTTQSTKKSTSSRTRSSETATETSTAETSSTKTKSNTKTSSTESSTQSASETSSASESTETDGASSTSSGDASSSSTSAASAPDTDGDNNGSQNTGAIIGGTISGVAALVALIFLGVWLWKRKKGNNGGNQKAQYVNIEALSRRSAQENRTMLMTNTGPDLKAMVTSSHYYLCRRATKIAHHRQYPSHVGL